MAGCSPSAAPVIDGWPIGAPVDCVGLTKPYCDGLVRVAEAGLGSRNPGHPAIAQALVFQEGSTPSASGVAQGDTRSEPVLVVRFDLADRTQAAIGVLDLPGGPEALAYGP